MSKLLIPILKLLITLLLPLVIILGAVRLLATEPYLAFEYSKTDFPEDPFGFDRAQRLIYASANLQFVTQDKPLTDLSEQKQNGVSLYNARELKHMQDVQNVYRVTWQVWQIALIMVVLSGLALAWRKESRPAFASALWSGGALTAGLVIVIGLTAIAAWQVWFIVFHQVFFAAGSWTFDFSDTLIRLFPEKFWYDSALTISSLSLIAGCLVFWLGSRFQRPGNREIEYDDRMGKAPRYIPALSFDWLTPIYDPLLRWGMREETFKRELIQGSHIHPGMHVLDLGCGTGTLTIMIKQMQPEAELTGLDGDQKVLEIARTKAAKAGVKIKLDHGMAYQLPYPDDAFDRVLTSLVWHHLTRDDKQRAFAEVYRVLRPGSELHIVDFGKPRGVYGRLASQLIKRMEQAGDNVKGLLPMMMRRAGFEQVEEPACYQTIFGSLSLYRGRKPVG